MSPSLHSGRRVAWSRNGVSRAVSTMRASIRISCRWSMSARITPHSRGAVITRSSLVAVPPLQTTAITCGSHFITLPTISMPISGNQRSLGLPLESRSPKHPETKFSCRRLLLSEVDEHAPVAEFGAVRRFLASPVKGSKSSRQKLMLTMNGTAQILMPLLNDGTECWRPVAATPLGAELFRVESSCDTNERWQFPSGSVVRCSLRSFAGGESGLAAFALVTPPTSTHTPPKSDETGIA